MSATFLRGEGSEAPEPLADGTRLNSANARIHRKRQILSRIANSCPSVTFRRFSAKNDQYILCPRVPSVALHKNLLGELLFIFLAICVLPEVNSGCNGGTSQQHDLRGSTDCPSRSCDQAESSRTSRLARSLAAHR